MHRITFALMTTLLSFAASAETLVYLGTDTGGSSQGIYVARFDESSGVLSEPRLATAIGKPGFLARHPRLPVLYSVATVPGPEGSPVDSVAAFAVQPDASLTLLNTQPSGGSGPCHVSVDGSGRVLMVANYNGGTITSYPLSDDGSVEPATTSIRHQGSSRHPQRQAAPHPHGIYPGPTQTLVYVPDLGLDKIMIYRLDAASARLEPAMPDHAATAAGAGPRHLAFHPDGRHAYASLELSSGVAAFKLDAGSGALQRRADYDSLPPGAPHAGNSTAEIAVHPDGRFLYVSNRGHDSIAAFAIEPRDGSLRFLATTPTEGRTPRHFAISPSGRFLLVANQHSATVVVLRVDPERGTLSPTEHRIAVDRPTYVRFFQR